MFLSVKSADQSITFEGSLPAQRGALYAAGPADGSVVLPGASSLSATFLSSRQGSSGGLHVPSFLGRMTWRVSLWGTTQYPASAWWLRRQCCCTKQVTGKHFEEAASSDGDSVPRPGPLGWWSGKGRGGHPWKGF